MRTQEDLLKIIKVYRRWTPFIDYCRKVKDRFGFFGEQLRPLPKYSEKTLEEHSIERAKELGNRYIMWSGGVDSTFVICAYIKAGVPFNVICDTRSFWEGWLFGEWLMRNSNVNVVKLDHIQNAWNVPSLLHADVADLLFSPDEKGRVILDDTKTFYENLGCYQERDELYQQVLDYGKLLNKPLDTNEQFVRLLTFGSFYFHGRDELNYLIFPERKIESFFDTTEFTDIAYSQYWDRTVQDNKPEMHRFICDVTQDERMMWAVNRRGSAITPRLPLTQENYVKWED